MNIIAVVRALSTAIFTMMGRVSARRRRAMTIAPAAPIEAPSVAVKKPA